MTSEKSEDVTEKLASKLQEELFDYEDDHLGNFRRIYPLSTDNAKYEKYFKTSCSLFKETVTHRVRKECARYGISIIIALYINFSICRFSC